MKYFKIVYNSFLWAMTAATLCFKSEWLQMRVNTGYIFFGLLLFLVIGCSIVSRKRRTLFNWIFTCGNLIVCSAAGLVFYGFDRMQVVPAALLREGIHQTRIPFSTINLLLLLFTAAGVTAIVVWDAVGKKQK